MRLRGALAALLAGALWLPSSASAQPGGASHDGEAANASAPDDHDEPHAEPAASTNRHPTEDWTAAAPPAMPASTVLTGLHLSLRAVEGVHGLDVAPVTRAEWAPHAHLALGVLFAPQVSFLGDGRTSLTQVALAPLHAWIGTGARWDGGGFGVRARATFSARLLGAPEADVGAETWSFALVLAAAHAFGPVELALELDAVLLSRGNFPRSAPGGAPYSGAGGGTLSARFGEPAWPVRPTLAIEVRGANDLGVAGRAALGAWISLPAEIALHVWLRGAWPGDPEALVGTLGIDVVALRL